MNDRMVMHNNEITHWAFVSRLLPVSSTRARIKAVRYFFITKVL